MSNQQYLFFKTSRNQFVDGWTAWGGLKRLTEDNMVRQPQEPLYFSMESSKEQAVAKLIEEVESIHGRCVPWEQ